MLAGVDDADDEDTSLVGVHGDDTSLAGVPVPNTTSQQTMMMTQMQNLITTLLTPTRPTSIQAKHPYTAPETTYQFAVQLVNHNNILQMRRQHRIA